MGLSTGWPMASTKQQNGRKRRRMKWRERWRGRREETMEGRRENEGWWKEIGL